ncbi:hypothetical protein KCU93_g9503, partial [Aureobasidium melanogenum]
MHHTIVAYNQKSKASNLCLVRNCVNAISSLNLPTEQEKLNRLAHILFMEKDWGRNEDFSKQPKNAPKQHEEQKDVAAREEMHESLEGENKAPKEATVVKTPKDTWVDLFTDDVVSRLDVLGGFQFGESIGLYQYQPIEQWHSYYLFCRYKPDAEEEEDAPYRTKDHTYRYKDHKTDAGWAWRVVIHLESDGNEGIDYPTRIFDSIVEFLDWYGDWYERLDLEDFLEDLVEDYEFGD